MVTKKKYESASESDMEEQEKKPEMKITPKKTKTRTGRRERHFVDKTYMDDKGYMVTKKKYESASESDMEEQEKKPEMKITPKKTKTRTGQRERRLVDKTYMDDKGYMVTKKKYESASESDMEEQE